MEFISKQNLIKAAIVGGGVMLALRMTGGKSKMIQGAAAVLTAAVAMPLAAKVG